MVLAQTSRRTKLRFRVWAFDVLEQWRLKCLKDGEGDGHNLFRNPRGLQFTEPT